MMTEAQKESLKTIEDQLYSINARNISLPWVGMQKKPTMNEILNLNKLLGFIIQEIRTLRETGELDVDKVHDEVFGEEK
jgi:hypothetical protein